MTARQQLGLFGIYLQVPVAAVLNTVPVDWHDRIIITTGFLQRLDGIPPNIASVNPLIGNDKSYLSHMEIFLENAKFPFRYGWQTQGRLPGSIGNSDKPGGGSGNGVYAGSQLGDR